MASIQEIYHTMSRETKLAVLIILVGSLLRFLLAFLSWPSGDSLGHLAAARYMARTFSIPLFEPIGREVFWPPPLFHFTAALFYLLFSPLGISIAEKSMQFVSPLFGSLTLVIFYFLLQKIVSNERVRLFAILFLTFIPLHIYYSAISHIDVFFTFWVVLGVYLAVLQKPWWCAVVLGLGLLTKYHMILLFPVCCWLLIADKSTLQRKIKTVGFVCIVALLIASPWYIRNTLALGNPIYHFLNPVFEKLGFHPLPFGARENANFNVFDPSWTPRLYLDLFGVPLGLPETLLHLPLPLMPLPLLIWLTITLFFFLPFFMAWAGREKDATRMLLLWIVPLLLMLGLYIVDYGDVYLRLFLPAIPAVAILWGYGMHWVDEKIPRRFIIVFLVICIATFVVGEVAKSVIAGQSYARYADDYAWAREHLPQDAYVMGGGGYLAYYLDRFVVPSVPFIPYNSSNVYYWVGDKNMYKVPITIPSGDEHLFLKIYENPKTHIQIYKKITSETAAPLLAS